MIERTLTSYARTPPSGVAPAEHVVAPGIPGSRDDVSPSENANGERQVTT